MKLLYEAIALLEKHLLWIHFPIWLMFQSEHAKIEASQGFYPEANERITFNFG